jgi:hypothetical protein
MLLGTPSGAADAVTRFHHLWTYCAITAALSGAIGLMIPKPSTAVVEQVGQPPREPAGLNADFVLVPDAL